MLVIMRRNISGIVFFILTSCYLINCISDREIKLTKAK